MFWLRAPVPSQGEVRDTRRGLPHESPESRRALDLALASSHAGFLCNSLQSMDTFFVCVLGCDCLHRAADFNHFNPPWSSRRQCDGLREKSILQKLLSASEAVTTCLISQAILIHGCLAIGNLRDSPSLY